MNNSVGINLFLNQTSDIMPKLHVLFIVVSRAEFTDGVGKLGSARSILDDIAWAAKKQWNT